MWVWGRGGGGGGGGGGRDGGGVGGSDATNAQAPVKHMFRLWAVYTRSAVGHFNLFVKRRTLSERGGPPRTGALGSCPVCLVLSSALV